ncbi:MAG: hypothetical protein KOO62_09300 [candidate division Zixibacteria bacterium]|nr:hypothetical protein [candidate division Zixibacteria bacterium]
MTSTAELDERISKCRKILEADANSQIFAALADSHRKKGELTEAFQICQQGLRIHGDYGPAHFVMAKINLDRGLFDWAEAEARKASSLDGSTRGIELLLAEIYIYQSRFDAAIKLLSPLHQSDPENGQIAKLLELARRLRDEQSRTVGSSSTMDSGGVPGSPSCEPARAPEPPISRPVELSHLDAAGLVTKAIEIPGMEGVIFVNFDGLIAESEWQSEIDVTLLGASFSEIINELNVKLFENCFGSLGTVLIETEGPTFMIARVEDGQFMLVAAADANLGTVKMRVEKLIQAYRS